MTKHPSNPIQLRLGFFGNLLGRNPGSVTTQAQILADLFADEGVRVVSASSSKNRLKRLLEIAASIIANRSKIDICVLELYSGLYMVLADLASRLCRLFDIKLVAVLHGGKLPEFARRYPGWTRAVLGRADILVAPSRFLRKEMQRGEFDIRVIPNVLELQNYTFKLRTETAPKLLWMRSFHPIYNPQMALRVLAEIVKSRSEATLVMAGVDKGLEGEMKEMAASLGIEARVRFPGFLSPDEKAKEFAEADIFINTNLVDNMPVSVVEACAFGLPVVATDVGGIPYLLSDGENALLVESNNAGEMAAAVGRLLDEPELAEKLSVNGRLLAEASSWESVRPMWMGLFEELAGDRNLGTQPAAEAVLSKT